MKELKLSKQTTYNYLKVLLADGRLRRNGSGFSTVRINNAIKTVKLAGLDESDVYMDWLRERLIVPRNIKDICQHGFTEMLNNAIDHSGSETADLFFEEDFSAIRLSISDRGIGIFKKIQQEKGLSILQHAILELAKGKCTTDRAHHNGKGILFTSKMFDDFFIKANGLVYRAKSEYAHTGLDEQQSAAEQAGSMVFMEICKASAVTAKEIFDQYTDEEMAFSKTVVPVIHLLDRRNEDTMTLVSRSQAKRLLVGFDRFQTVVLDFAGIEAIGQGFADEAFRVYPHEHPEVEITYKNVNEDVEKMIKHVTC